VSSDAYDRLVPEKHFLRRLDRAVDFTFVEDLCKGRYKSAEGGPGRPAEPPVRLFKLLLLMFLYQVKFERELERRANDSVSWRWYCGYAPDEPVASHKTIWLFRKRLGPEMFDKIFARILKQCMESGLVDNRRWHVDATKQDAAATRLSQFQVAVVLTQAMVKRLASMQGVEQEDPGAPPREMDDEMKVLVARAASKAAGLKGCDPKRVVAKAEGKAYEPDGEDEDADDPGGDAPCPVELEKLAKELENEQPPCNGDKDARIGCTSSRGSFCGYLATAVVDEKRGIVLSYETNAGNVDQQNTFSGPYSLARERAGKPEEMAGDTAFDTLAIRKQLKADGVKGYIAMIRPSSKGRVFGSERFTVKQDAEGSYEVECPAGHAMKQVGQTKEGFELFRGACCAGCVLQSRCTKARNGIRQFRFKPELRQFQEEHWLLRKTSEYRAAMKARMATIESRFGHGKTYHNLGKCIYRSKVMTRIQTAMALLVLNLEKLVTYGAMAPQQA
jgi:transposase